MFPLDFPLRVLAKRAEEGDWVLDPFSGRGTTNYAARVLGLPSIGIDSSPVATSLTEAKLANTTPDAIMACANRLLAGPTAAQIPQGEFWSLAFHSEVLESICRIREALLLDCRSSVRKALRAIMMGALHGPRNKNVPSYFSNQCTRTYAPKPGYSVKYWRERHLSPPKVDVRKIVQARALRYYKDQDHAEGLVIRGDSRSPTAFRRIARGKVRWVITSPPYYGMRTYIPDQWLRHWFLGGSDTVDYSNESQFSHGSPESFAEQLRSVWDNVAAIGRPDIRMVIRFGGIADRKAEPLSILKESITNSSWALKTVKLAGSASCGRRQSLLFSRTQYTAQVEFDAWLQLRYY